MLDKELNDLIHQLNCLMHSAPKARDVKAWANGPGYGGVVVEALKARNEDWSAVKKRFYVAPSALRGFAGRLPGALPQAIALRTFGAN